MRSALSDRARNDRIFAITDLISGQTPSTKTAKAFLETAAVHRTIKHHPGVALPLLKQPLGIDQVNE